MIWVKLKKSRFKNQITYLGNEKVVELLLKNRASIWKHDISGETALDLAAFKGIWRIKYFQTMHANFLIIYLR